MQQMDSKTVHNNNSQTLVHSHAEPFTWKACSDVWNWAFPNSESVKPLCRKMIHCFEALQSDHISRNIWFRSGLRSGFTNHLSKSLTWMIELNWMIRDPRYESWSEMMVRESLFKSVLGVGSEISWFRLELRISQNIWFRLQSAFCKSLIQFRASERVRKYFISDQKMLMPLMLHV